MLLTPLEQFQIISLYSIKLFCLDFSLTNMLFINMLVLAIVSLIVNFSTSETNGISSFFLIPNNWQLLLETAYEVVSQLVFDNLNEEGEKYFPFIAVLFTFM